MTVRAVEGKGLWEGGTAITVDNENRIISLNLRDENNLIIYDSGDDEIYVDLQLPDGIKPLDAFPVGITTGRVLIADDWDVTGTIICAKTTSGDNIKILYGDDNKLYVDNGTGTFKEVAFKSYVDNLIQTLRTYVDEQLATKADDNAVVKLTGDQSIDGVKTYTSSPVVPTPTNNMDASTKKYVDDAVLGATLTAGTNIQISNQNVISATDTTYSAGANITIDANNVISATDTTYSAGNGLSLNGTTFSADTTVLATKSDIANLGSFTVVASLPSLATADEKTIYLLGPIGTGTDKYEEWIVTESTGTLSFVYDSFNDEFTPSSFTLTGTTTISYVSSTGIHTSSDFIINDSNNVAVAKYSKSISSGGWYIYENSNWTFVDSTNVTIPGGTYNTASGGGLGHFDSLSFSTLSKQWTKTGETSVDLSNYLAKDNTTAFSPSGNYNPATKKYVDDSVTVVSGDSGVTYTIKVSNSNPASGTASNIVTLVP